MTIPDKATDHIKSILNSHASFCGLPEVKKICTSKEVIPRLTWVAAGVPRDALNLFSNAMTKAVLAGKKSISMFNINLVASESVNIKLQDLENDTSDSADELKNDLNTVKKFCINQEKKNAFLVEIRPENLKFQNLQKLVDLRLLHVINEDITVSEANRKYLGLILDYGFYIGIRAARSVDLFNKQTTKVIYKDLRKLPILKL